MSLRGEPSGPVVRRQPIEAPLTVRVRRVGGAPVVAVRVWLFGGARQEKAPGLSLVTGRMLSEGSRRRDWRQIALEAEDRGMSIHGFGGFEGHGLSVEALADDWDLALAWAAELVREPTFPADRFEWTLQQAAAELESFTDQPAVVASWRFLDQLYRPHPRCRPLHGSAASLERLAREDCAGHHEAGLGRGLLVTVAGRIDEQEVAARIGELFSGTTGVTSGDAEPPAPTGIRETHLLTESGGADQAHLYMGHLTVERRHPDHPALLLLGVVLGSGPGLTGRIPTRIREQEGLAYSAYADTVTGAGRDPGRLVIYLGTSPETVARAEAAAREEIALLLEQGVAEEEAEMSLSYALGSEPFRRETARQWADILLEAEITGLPVDRPDWLRESLEGVDRAELDRVAREHIRPDRLKVTVGLPGRGETDGNDGP